MNRTKDKRALGENLKKVLHRTKFCTFCFDSDENLFNLDDEVKGDWEGEGLPLNEMLDVIFGNASLDLLSKFICKPCLSSAISCYRFITRSLQTGKLYSEYLTNLTSQISDVILCGDGEWASTLIVLENIDSTNTPKNVKVKVYICDLCGKEYCGKGSLRNHISKHTSEASEPIDCPRCQKRPCRHEKYLAAVDSQMSQCKEVITCIGCSKPVKSTAYLIAHIHKKHLDHLESITCKECGETFPSTRKFKIHSLYNHSSKFACDVCFQFFGTDHELKVHVTSCHGTLSLIKPELSNSFAFVDSGDNDEPQVNLPLKHKTNIKDVKKIKSKKKVTKVEEYKYDCLVCNKVFKSIKALKEHKRLHKKPNSCDYCNIIFDSRKEYIEHTLTFEHKRKIPYRYSCKHCEYHSVDRNSLVAHTNRMHLKIRPYKCEYCPSSYFSKVHFYVHMKAHTEPVKPVICDVCGLSFKSLRGLKKHRLRHTGEKPYSCPHCDVKVTCLSSLKSHMAQHNDRTVQCPLCGSMFHTIARARSHVQKVHWKSKEKFDYTKLEGLSPKDYHLFKDRRKAI